MALVYKKYIIGFKKSQLLVLLPLGIYVDAPADIFLPCEATLYCLTCCMLSCYSVYLCFALYLLPYFPTFLKFEILPILSSLNDTSFIRCDSLPFDTPVFCSYSLCNAWQGHCLFI